MSGPASALPATLQQARKVRRLSQLELSMRLGVSQRHVSFVEGGRSRPSRELLVAWLAELGVPLPVRNEALLQAGYAPAYGASRRGDPALERLLAAHEPLPALVIDAHWDLVRLNRGGRWLAATLMPGSVPPGDGPTVNLLDLLVHPEGLTTRIVNLQEVGPAMLAHLRHEAYAQPTLAPRVEAFAERLRARLGARRLQAGWAHPAAPVLTTRYATPHGELSFFSMFTTFGTPQDITLASLRVEHMFAADEATRAVIAARAEGEE
jgi:transcriptional regulator with XRE-family HTH domain